jgi:pyrroline-5-carboxylate reductase
MKVGIIGCGTLGRAIASGLLQHEGVREILVTTRRGVPIASLPDLAMATDNVQLVERCDVVLLCVKPFQLEAVAREIAPSLRPGHLVISTAASVTSAQVHDWIDGHAPIVRVMPNMPCRVGYGMTVLSRGIDATEAHISLVQSLFDMLGRTVAIDESLMDAATAISGCGPAYAYLIIEALSDAGVKLGISYDVARLLVAQTMLGSAQMVLESGAHPALLKNEVTTPAGCTVDGLMELEDGKLRSTLLRAAVAAATRSASLR